MADRDDVPYIVIERQAAPGFAPFVWGALLGAAVALLLAPRSGVQTRQEIGESVRRLRETASGTARQVRDTVTGTVEDVRTEITSRIDAARNALEEGRTAARETRADMERRVRQTRAAFRAARHGEDGEDALQDDRIPGAPEEGEDTLT